VQLPALKRGMNAQNIGKSIAPARKILWIAEAVTLAHVARPLAAHRSLESQGWSSAIACDPRAKKYLDAFEGEYIPLASVEPKQFLWALRKWTRTHSKAGVQSRP
jgi:UDP:flavonoid glycosyltransferase YjiC (YdhE family)